MGGSWTIMLAARHPELVGKAMVVDMLPYLGIMMRAQGMTEEQMTAQIDRMQTALATAQPEQRRMMTTIMVSAMINTESEKQPNINASLASDQVVAAQGFTDLMRTNLLDDVARIRAPLVVLYTQPASQPGGPTITPEQIDRADQLSYRGAPQALVRRVPNSAHFIMFDNAPFFQAQLREFLTTPGTPRPDAPPAQ
jgi:pimeloyl-ACP methyl ester carboxylesterase